MEMFIKPKLPNPKQRIQSKNKEFLKKYKHTSIRPPEVSKS